MIRYKEWIFSGLLLAAVGVMIVSCKKYPDPPPVFEKYQGDTASLQQRKVLVISIDGATGSEVQKMAPPNISALEQHGKYTYNVLNDVVTTDVSSWVSMLTGVGFGKHQLWDSSFQFVQSGNWSEGSYVNNYPTIFSYILQSQPDDKFAIITPWAGLANYASDVDYDISTANDAAVKDSAVSLLNHVTPLSVMFVDFNEAELAGNAGGFSTSNPAYKSAILTADGYVGDIVNALKSRKNYNNENWLIIVTTNHGGSAANPKPGFVVYSNPSLIEEEVKKSGLSAVAFHGSGSDATYATMNPVVNGNLVYDFQKDFTIQFDVMFGPQSGAYPAFFGNKMELNGGSTNGFSFLIDYYPTWTFNTTSGNKFQVATNTSVLGDGKWHTVAITVEQNPDGSRTASAYTDGVLRNSGTLPANANLNSSDPLAIGWQPATPTSGDDNITTFVHNIKLFDEALADSAMEANQCLQDITQAQGYDHLVGFWPCDEGTGGAFFNAINSSCPFILHGSPKWQNVGTILPCSVDPSVGNDTSGVSIVTSTVDVSANMLYWLKINISTDWNMDGQPWLNNFDKEIYGVK